MVLARVANLFSPGIPNSLVDNGRNEGEFAMEGVASLPDIRQEAVADSAVVEVEVDDEAARPPYIHVGPPN